MLDVTVWFSAHGSLRAKESRPLVPQLGPAEKPERLFSGFLQT